MIHSCLQGIASILMGQQDSLPLGVLLRLRGIFSHQMLVWTLLLRLLAFRQIRLIILDLHRCLLHLIRHISQIYRDLHLSLL